MALGARDKGQDTGGYDLSVALKKKVNSAFTVEIIGGILFCMRTPQRNSIPLFAVKEDDLQIFSLLFSKSVAYVATLSHFCRLFRIIKKNI
jgi:hypothetical protein